MPRKKNFCDYEPILPSVEEARVVVVDCLLRAEEDLSDLARNEPDFDAEEWVNEERTIAGFAIGNITSNVKKLIRNPDLHVVHVSDFTHDSLAKLKPDAVILSGTLRDFDFYSSRIWKAVGSVVTTTTVPLLGICGGHQIIGQSFGHPILTLDGKRPHEKREDRMREYEYHFVRVTKSDDPIFEGVLTSNDPRRRSRANTMWVWQNHGLMVDGVPEGFTLLAKGYMCRNQMMVKRGDGQLIYTVQFHIEKSFEDWRKTQTRWEHHNESRDGRLLFENFLFESLKHTRKQIPRAAAGRG